MVRRRLRMPTLLLGLSLCQAAATDAQPVTRAEVAHAPDGVAISYRVLGDRGRTLVFVHGWACDQSYWSHQLEYFMTRARIVTVDLAGHGESGTNRSEWSISRFAQDVIAVLEAEDLDDVVLIGHSLGGPVVLEAALRATGRVSGVVGVDTFFDGWLQPGMYTDLLEGLRQDFRTTTREWLVRNSFVESSPPALVDRIAVDMSAQPPASGIASLVGLSDWGPARMRDALEAIGVPLGVIQRSGAIASLGLVEAQRSRLPAASVVEMDGVGHFMMSEDAARFNELLWDLLVDLGLG